MANPSLSPVYDSRCYLPPQDVYAAMKSRVVFIALIVALLTGCVNTVSPGAVAAADRMCASGGGTSMYFSTHPNFFSARCNNGVDVSGRINR